MGCRKSRLQATITGWRKSQGPLRSPGRLHWLAKATVGGPVARGARGGRFCHANAPVAVQPHGLSDAFSARPYFPRKTRKKRQRPKGHQSVAAEAAGTRQEPRTSCAPVTRKNDGRLHGARPDDGRAQAPPPASVAVLLSCRFRLRPLSRAWRHRKTATLARPPTEPDSPAFATFRSVNAPVATTGTHTPIAAPRQKRSATAPGAARDDSFRYHCTALRKTGETGKDARPEVMPDRKVPKAP